MTAGHAKLRAALLLGAVAATGLIAAPGCRLGGAPRGGDQEEAPAPQPANPVLAVSAAKVATTPMRSELRLLGITAATRHVILRAPVAGRVLGMKLKVGDVVRPGQVIARVLSHEVEAAEQGLEVARKLDPQDVAALAGPVKRHTDRAGLAVKAPESGVVSTPPVTSGQMVGYLDPLVDLIDPASVYVDAAVPVDDLHMLAPGMSAVVTSPLKPGAELSARVAAILPSFNRASATSPVRLEFSGDGRITGVGAPVEVRIITRSVADATVIPAAALFQDTDGGFHVFVAGPDGRAHRVPVTPGMRTPDQVQVVSGLHPGQSVITSGGYALSDGLKVSVITQTP